MRNKDATYADVFPLRTLSVWKLLSVIASSEVRGMSLVRLLGFTTLACGCVVGKYREVATSREVSYVEEKGKTCGSHAHRRNHTIVSDRLATVTAIALSSKAS